MAVTKAPKKPFLWFLRSPRNHDPRLPGGTPGRKSYDDLRPPPRGKAGIVIDRENTGESPAGEEEEATDTPHLEAAPAAQRVQRIVRMPRPRPVPVAAAPETPEEQLATHSRFLDELSRLIDDLPDTVPTPLSVRLRDLAREARENVQVLGARLGLLPGLAPMEPEPSPTEQEPAPVLELDPGSEPGQALVDAAQSWRDSTLDAAGVPQGPPSAALVDPEHGWAVQIFDLSREGGYATYTFETESGPEALIEEAMRTLPRDQQDEARTLWTATKVIYNPVLESQLAKRLTASVRQGGWPQDKIDQLNQALLGMDFMTFNLAEQPPSPSTRRRGGRGEASPPTQPSD
jgi:hypothetical protein